MLLTCGLSQHCGDTFALGNALVVFRRNPTSLQRRRWPLTCVACGPQHTRQVLSWPTIPLVHFCEPWLALSGTRSTGCVALSAHCRLSFQLGLLSRHCRRTVRTRLLPVVAQTVSPSLTALHWRGGSITAAAAQHFRGPAVSARRKAIVPSFPLTPSSWGSQARRPHGRGILPSRREPASRAKVEAQQWQ